MLDFGLLFLRVSSGLLMLICHGWGKLYSYSTVVTRFPDPLGLGAKTSLLLTIFAEVACAALVVVGFKTRLASVPLVITMLVAAFIVHGNDPFKKQEFALIYGVIFLALIFTGSGKYSLDSLVFKKR